MIFVDTGYFVALSNRRDELHARAQAWAAWWQRAGREPLLLTEYVLVETLNLLSSPRFHAAAHRIADAVRTEPIYVLVPASRALLDAGIDLHRQRPDQGWSVTDCISFRVMNEHGVTRALAHDKHFIQAGFEGLLRQDPPT